MAEPVQDDTVTPPAYPPAPRRRARWPLLLAVATFALGVGGTVWLGTRGYLEGFGLSPHMPARVAAQAPVAANTAAAVSSDASRAELEKVSNVEARLAMVEDRLSRIDFQANAASGNAARAEGLLVAFAARRMIDRGEPLRFLADQVKLRFANAQPRAVGTIIRFARDPVTADQLAARLEALSPDLTGGSDDASFLDRALNDISNLFTVRREPSEVTGPEAAVERARVMLRAGRIEEAVAQVQRLPGADAADKWIADARRYAEVHDALDLIETAAMLEPGRLRDAQGRPVDEPSPLARPPAAPDAQPE